MYKVRKQLLPLNIQKWFKDRDGGYQLRWDSNFQQPRTSTTRKSMCISVCGVKLWNNLTEEAKHCRNLAHFKTLLKGITLAKYSPS